MADGTEDEKERRLQCAIRLNSEQISMPIFNLSNLGIAQVLKNDVPSPVQTLWPRDAIKSMAQYCERFPSALVRQGIACSIRVTGYSIQISTIPFFGVLSWPRNWKYDNKVKEYFIETSTKQTIRQSELQRRTEISDRGEPLQQYHHRMI